MEHLLALVLLLLGVDTSFGDADGGMAFLGYFPHLVVASSSHSLRPLTTHCHGILAMLLFVSSRFKSIESVSHPRSKVMTGMRCGTLIASSRGQGAFRWCCG